MMQASVRIESRKLYRRHYRVGDGAGDFNQARDEAAWKRYRRRNRLGNGSGDIDQARDIAVYLFEPFMYCPACSFNAKVCDLLMLLNLFHNNVFLQSHFSIEVSFMATEDKSPSSVVKC